MTDPLSSLPGLQALIEQKFFTAQWVDRAENSRVLTAYELGEIARRHAGGPLPSRYEYRSAERAELEYLRAALLVVQGGVQQDEKATKDDPRSRCGSAAPERLDLRDETPTSDVPSLNGWQPIATAPKGEMVLLWLNRAIATGVTHNGTDVFANGWTEQAQPTHWMPLPDPPSPATARPTDGNSAESATSDTLTSSSATPTPLSAIAQLFAGEREHEHCHDLVCNGDRRYQRGSHGFGCSCHSREMRLYAEVLKLRDFVGRVRYEFKSDAEEARTLLGMERTHAPDSAEILSSERRTPDGPRDTSLDSSTTSPTHGGTEQRTTLEAGTAAASLSQKEEKEKEI